MFFKAIYILILFFTIIIDYIAGIYIEKAVGKKQKKKYLVISLIANVGVLIIFKYFNFLNDNISGIVSWMGYTNPIPYLNILLPIGLSFHTFQAMSYTIEIYRGNQKAEKHFGIYSLYVMFYPQLVAGPIERPQNVLHQFYEKHEFNYSRVVSGLQLMMWGFFKKVVIADRLAPMVNSVYNDPVGFEGLPMIISTFFFAFQIYCDFSGYSDIALGSAEVMGFKLMRNFRRPYFATSISDFWRRWHISLSTWFRDYVYIPLGGNRVGKWRSYFNLFIIFLLSGVWHGANWTYIIWGVLHSFYTIFGNITLTVRNQISEFLRLNYFSRLVTSFNVITTFCLVTFAWIFFRANTVSDALYIIRNMFNFKQGLGFNSWLDAINIVTSNDKAEFLLALLAIIFLELVHKIQSSIYPKGLRDIFVLKPAIVRFSIYLFALFAILFFGIFTHSQFIYFQF